MTGLSYIWDCHLDTCLRNVSRRRMALEPKQSCWDQVPAAPERWVRHDHHLSRRSVTGNRYVWVSGWVASVFILYQKLLILLLLAHHKTSPNPSRSVSSSSLC